MTRKGLPDGVPASNDEAALGKAVLQIAETATPRFIADTTNSGTTPSDTTAQAFRQTREVYVRIDEDDEDEDSDDNNETSSDDDRDDDNELVLHSHPNSMLLVLLAIALILLALGGVIFANNNQSAPQCSDQPTWNQYNCSAG